MNKIDNVGNIYSGNFVYMNNDVVLHGHGDVTNVSGIIYTGYFIYGQKHGLFTVKNVKTKEMCSVRYEYDKIVT
jgi:hypothetical protein